MYQYKGLDDTIAAISTPIGQGGIGIIRISGQNSLSITDKIFSAKNGESISSAKGFTIHYGNVVNDGEVIDEVLVTLMRAPKSYTTEDVVEISCHGGIAALRAILSLVVDQGARLAEPGEFTKRAFMGGRIDLTQAEAVLDIIQSKTDAFLKVSTHQLKGELSVQLELMREKLMTSYVKLEAFVNFPEDDIDQQSREKICQNLKEAAKRVEELLKNADQGRILKEGIKIIICGKPNVGKSSLLNVLLKTPRAIVSDIAGTTRDTIEETTQIDGIPFQIVDTAGILEPRDKIEEEAIKRSHMYVEGADQILLVLDGSAELSGEDKNIIDFIKDKNVIVLLNKCDLACKIGKETLSKDFNLEQVLEISATKDQGIDILMKKIVSSVLHGQTISAHGILVSNLRHIDALKQTLVCINSAVQSFVDDLSLEFISEEIKIAVNSLDAITGRNVDADLIENIFSKFCVGK